jgi:hypothetical protein
MADKAHFSGWHTISLTGSGLPIGGTPFTVTVSYTAPQAPSPL